MSGVLQITTTICAALILLGLSMAGVPFFFKQGGKIVHTPELDGQTWAQFPEDYNE